MMFGPPQYILGDNDLKSDCTAAQDFARRFNIQWKCKLKCNPQGNRVVERIVGTLKKALQKVTRSESKEWDASFESVIYRYRNRPGPDGVAPFEVLYGAKSRFPVEPYDAIPRAELLSNACPFELAIP